MCGKELRDSWPINLQFTGFFFGALAPCLYANNIFLGIGTPNLINFLNNSSNIFTQIRKYFNSMNHQKFRNKKSLLHISVSMYHATKPPISNIRLKTTANTVQTCSLTLSSHQHYKLLTKKKQKQFV